MEPGQSEDAAEKVIKDRGTGDWVKSIRRNELGNAEALEAGIHKHATPRLYGVTDSDPDSSPFDDVAVIQGDQSLIGPPGSRVIDCKMRREPMPPPSD